MDVSGMAKYIDREALVEWLKRIPLKDLSDGRGLCRVIFEDDFKRAIKKIPKGIIVDVAPVVHAHWQPYEDTVQCSACGFGTFMGGYFFAHGECTHANDRSFRFSFCPNCGAKMDGGEY